MTVYNFNAGPAIMPAAVLERAQEELRSYQGGGISILEMSHRSKEYEAVNAQAEERLKRLLGLGAEYRVLFMQGGASAQFALIPMNFLGDDGVADYLLTGTWSQKARDEAAKYGQVHVAASTEDEQFRRIPGAAEISLSADPAYVHMTTNNTIYGTQWHSIPDVGGRQLIADMSSDILARPLEASRFAMIYAGAQKNLGPSGVTVVVIKDALLAKAAKGLPTIFSYGTHAKNNSLYNTPPTFAVYMVNLVLGWIEERGGLAAMEEHNRRKAGAIYGAIDESGGFYRGHAEVGSRSLMNITFRLPTEEQEKAFVAAAKAEGMIGLAGHRSVGGVRASVYNAMTQEGAEALAGFMRRWAETHG